MMRIALYGATGRAGSRILSELVSRGHHGIAIARDRPPQASSEQVEWKTDDLTDVAHMVEVIHGADAVVSAYAPPPANTDALLEACRRLTDAVAQSGVSRLLVVGGAGVLQVAPGVTLIQSGKLPPEWLPIAQSHAATLAMLEHSSIDWTYLSPAAMFEPGERTGQYRTAVDQLLIDGKGESRISMEDYAIAMLDELERPRHRRARFAVAW